MALCAFSLMSCEGFLNCEPQNEVSSDAFMTSGGDVKLYLNVFCRTFCPVKKI